MPEAARASTPAARAPAPARPPTPAPTPARPTTASATTARAAATPAVQLTGNSSSSAVIRSGGGEPLAPDTRRLLERSYNVDLRSVRVHTDTRAQNAARSMSARAFTVGSDIFLGPGERPNDLRLVAHEVAHVVQQRSAPAVQRWSFDRGDHFEREAHQAATAVTQQQPFTVSERTNGQRVQRLGLSDALDYIADAANNIPGFSMLTFVLGFNPVNMRSVERNATNLFRAIIGFLPGGNLIFQALQRHGIIDRVGAWLQQQLNTLGMAASSLRQALDRFLDSLSWTDIFDLGGVWNRARRIFTEPIDRIISFLGGVVGDILRFIRDAILRPVARLAEGTRAYDLMRLVLGQDPITGDPYPRTAENMIGGFMRLIGQEEKWQHLQQSRAIPRAWAWFQQQVATLLGFVRQIPQLFVQLWESLQISDLLDIGGAFNRVRNIFGGFVGNFMSWAGNAALQIMMFIFEVLAPGAMPILRRAASVIRTIISDPIRFVGNLVRAGLQGFRQFAANIGTHLINGLVGWLTGALSGAGLQLPARWDLRGILSLVLQILGLTWQNIRQKLVRVLGETTVTVLERTFDIVLTLVRDGPAAAWQKILENLQNLQEMVFGQIREWVTRTIVVQAVTRIASMLNPAGAVIQAIIAIYNTIMFVRERLQQIMQVAEAFFNSIAQIASGAVGAAANYVERTMARLVPVVISFLARLIGLGGISDTIRNIIARIRAPIDRALDRVVDWIRNAARNVLSRVLGGNPNAPSSERVTNALREAVPIVNRYAGRTVGAAILRPLLLPLKLRHRLTSLDVIARGDIWLVEAAASPGVTAPTGAKVAAEETSVVISVISTRQPRASTILAADIPQLATQTSPAHFELSTTRAVEQATGLSVEPQARFLTQERPSGIVTSRAPQGFTSGPQGLLLPTTPRLFGSVSGDPRQRDIEEPQLEVRGGDLRRRGLARHPDALLVTPQQVEPLEFTLDATLSMLGQDQTRGATPHKIMQIPGTIDVILRSFPKTTPIVYTVFVRGNVPQERTAELERELRRLQRVHGNIDVTITFVRR